MSARCCHTFWRGVRAGRTAARMPRCPLKPATLGRTPLKCSNLFQCERKNLFLLITFQNSQGLECFWESFVESFQGITILFSHLFNCFSKVVRLYELWNLLTNIGSYFQVYYLRNSQNTWARLSFNIFFS